MSSRVQIWHLVLLMGITSMAFFAKAGSPAGRPPGKGWDKVREEDGITIYRAEAESFGTNELVAILEANVSPAAAFTVVTDYDKYPQFMPYVKEAALLERSGGHDFVYMLVSPPVLSSRDYVMDIKPVAGDASTGGVFRTSWTLAPDKKPERDGIVRGKVNTGSWTLEPIDGGARTRFTYSLLTTIGGAVPQFIANKASVGATVDQMKAVRQRCEAAGKKQ